MNITVEKNAESIVITLPSSINPIDLQNGLRYFKFIEISSRSKATNVDIEELSKSVKSAMAKPIIERLRTLDEFKEI
ncbi:MAG: hypothetical protein WBA17_16125 [Saprospiraceae bacterium]